MLPVQVIEATQRRVVPTPENKLRVAAYCRISLDDGSDTSLPNQMAYFENYIKENPTYEFSGLYYDDGISGTSTKNRDGFNRMMEDVEAHKLDMIVTKSISRFSRNIVVTLSSLRKCEECGVVVFFQKENLRSDDPKTQLLLTIMSSLSEQESASISANVSMGIRYHFQQGIPMINCSRFLGYWKDKNTNKLMIEPREAAIIRWIFRSFLEGFTVQEIAKKLREAQVPAGGGKTNWPVDSIRYILQNEKYVGDLLMQKTYVESFLTHKSVKNEGKLPQYFAQDNHAPIVPRDVFNIVQARLMKRSKSEGHPGQRRYALSGKVMCGQCGTAYKRFAGQRQGEASGMIPVWKCKARYNAKMAAEAYARRSQNETADSSWRCHNHIIEESKLLAAVDNALAQLPQEMANILLIQESCRNLIAMGEGEKVAEAQVLLLHIDTALRYLRKRNLSTASMTPSSLRTLAAMPSDENPYEVGEACRSFDEFLKMAMVEVDDPVESLIEKVVVNGTEISVIFKCGIVI